MKTDHAHCHDPTPAPKPPEENPHACCAHETVAAPTVGSTVDKGIYTCPMHPEVRQQGPGTCPKCGMALEPLKALAEDEPNEELADMKNRFWGALGLTTPIFALEVAWRVIHKLLEWLPAIAMERMEMTLATPVVLWAGWPFLVRGAKSVRSGNLNMFTLIALGTLVAWGYSVAAALKPGMFPRAFQQQDGTVHVYFEAAAVITTLVLLGQVLELRAREATGGAIRALMSLAPKTARRRIGNEEDDVPLDTVAVGDILRVLPGGQVPVDGVVTDGESSVDESMMTGESMPVHKNVGAKVTGGTLNGDGSFLMRAEKVGGDTVLAHIIHLVGEAQRSRAPIQRLADVVAAWFVPAVITVAIISSVYWVMFGPQPAYAFAIVSAVSVLIIACPCALGLATPMSIMVGIGQGAKAGVLIRNAEALERFEKVDTLVVDKTGTLTAGKPAVTATVGSEGFDDNAVLALAAALETGSEHPLARAVLAAAKGKTIPSISGFQAVAGKGVKGIIDAKTVALGNAALMEQEGIAIPPALAAKAQELRSTGATAMFLGSNGNAVGVIGVSDPIKETTPAAIAALRKAGLHIVMLTGDNKATADAVAKQLGIDEVMAEVLPQDKANAIKQLQAQKRVIAMAGDGVNDAPALSTADVGIAMGTGADVAMQSAAVTLVKGDLGGIVRARKLSQKTMSNIRQNLFFAFIYNAAGVPVAAGALYPFFHIVMNPMIAAAAMSLSSVSVIVNALRLKWVRL